MQLGPGDPEVHVLERLDMAALELSAERLRRGVLGTTTLLVIDSKNHSDIQGEIE